MGRKAESWCNITENRSIDDECKLSKVGIFSLLKTVKILLSQRNEMKPNITENGSIDDECKLSKVGIFSLLKKVKILPSQRNEMKPF